MCEDTHCVGKVMAQMRRGSMHCASRLVVDTSASALQPPVGQRCCVVTGGTIATGEVRGGTSSQTCPARRCLEAPPGGGCF